MSRSFERFVVNVRKNAMHPLDAAELLNDAAKALGERYIKEAKNEKTTPFFVEDVFVDLYEGQIVFYCEKNE